MEQPLAILVVDDSKADRLLVKMAFSRTNSPAKVQYCADGDTAWQKLVEAAEADDNQPPSTCLIDINMPGMSGFDLLTRMKNHDRLKSIPVVMFSSSDRNNDIERSYELQASGYIQKPNRAIDLDTVAVKLTDLWMNTFRLPGRDRPTVN